MPTLKAHAFLAHTASFIHSTKAPTTPLRLTPQNLFYLLLRFQALGLDVGELDRPLPPELVGLLDYAPNDRSANKQTDWMETASFMSAVSAVSTMTLGGWWGTPKIKDPDADVKVIYSAFTKLPSLVIYPSGPMDDVIEEMAGSGPLDTVVPLKVFKNLQSQVLEIHSIPPSALMIPPSHTLRSLIIKNLNSPSADEEGQWIVPVLFGEPAKNERVPPPVVEGQEDEGIARDDDEERSLKFPHLSHLGLPSGSLLTFPALPKPLPSVVSLDLSSNLLIEVPQSLACLPSLISLNLGGNMIDSLRGIDKIFMNPSSHPQASRRPGLKVLSLDNNRIANLHGLSSLRTLQRLSLRSNFLAESLELSRLVTLPVLQELHVLPQPFVGNPAEAEWRVAVWEAFVKEGRGEEDVRIDGVGCGWVEKRKIRASARIIPRSANGETRRHSEAAYGTAHPRHPQVVNVGVVRRIGSSGSLHSPATATRKLVPDGSRTSTPTSPSFPVQPSPTTTTTHPDPTQPVLPTSPHISSRAPVAHPPTGRTKRNRKRIVNLDEGAREDSGNSTGTEVVKSDDDGRAGEIKQRPEPDTFEPALSNPPPTLAQSPPSTSPAHSSLRVHPTQPRGSSRRARLSSSVYEPSPDPSSSASSSSSKYPPGGSAEHTPLESSEEFRRKLEAMRMEVGDGWLRVLTATEGGSASASGSGKDRSGFAPLVGGDESGEVAVKRVLKKKKKGPTREGAD